MTDEERINRWIQMMSRLRRFSVLDSEEEIQTQQRFQSDLYDATWPYITQVIERDYAKQVEERELFMQQVNAVGSGSD